MLVALIWGKLSVNFQFLNFKIQQVIENQKSCQNNKLSSACINAALLFGKDIKVEWSIFEKSLFTCSSVKKKIKNSVRPLVTLRSSQFFFLNISSQLKIGKQNKLRGKSGNFRRNVKVQIWIVKKRLNEIQINNIVFRKISWRLKRVNMSSSEYAYRRLVWSISQSWKLRVSNLSIS